MDWHNIIVIALFAVGAISAVIFLYLFRKYIAPWFEEKCELIRQEIGDEQYASLVEYIKTFMAMAEVQLGGGNGKEKSALVIEWITSLFPGIDSSYVQALIDGFMRPLAQQGLLHMKEE